MHTVCGGVHGCNPLKNRTTSHSGSCRVASGLQKASKQHNRERERERERERDTHKQGERNRESEREREMDRQRQKQTNKQTVILSLTFAAERAHPGEHSSRDLACTSGPWTGRTGTAGRAPLLRSLRIHQTVALQWNTNNNVVVM